MTTKHTDGPWQFLGGNQIRSDKHQIARVWMMRNGEGIANAHLIKASPELFAALKRAKEWIESIMVDEFGWPSERVQNPPEGSHLHAINAAIAKAEGSE